MEHGTSVRVWDSEARYTFGFETQVKSLFLYTKEHIGGAPGDVHHVCEYQTVASYVMMSVYCA